MGIKVIESIRNNGVTDFMLNEEQTHTLKRENGTVKGIHGLRNKQG